MQKAVHARIEELKLIPHPEGGFYRETHRSELVLPPLPGYAGPRRACTSILFLLPAGVVSRWHRVASEELWLFHEGDPLTLAIRHDMTDDDIATHLLSRHHLQACVPSNAWQQAEACAGPHGYALVGCVVAPGFEFEDFEMASPEGSTPP